MTATARSLSTSLAPPAVTCRCIKPQCHASALGHKSCCERCQKSAQALKSLDHFNGRPYCVLFWGQESRSQVMGLVKQRNARGVCTHMRQLQQQVKARSSGVTAAVPRAPYAVMSSRSRTSLLGGEGILPASSADSEASMASAAWSAPCPACTPQVR